MPYLDPVWPYVVFIDLALKTTSHHDADFNGEWCGTITLEDANFECGKDFTSHTIVARLYLLGNNYLEFEDKLKRDTQVVYWCAIEEMSMAATQAWLAVRMQVTA